MGKLNIALLVAAVCVLVVCVVVFIAGLCELFSSHWTPALTMAVYACLLYKISEVLLKGALID